MDKKYCTKCQRIKRKCICRQERRMELVEMRSRVSSGPMENRKKEQSRKKCREKVRV